MNPSISFMARCCGLFFILLCFGTVASGQSNADCISALDICEKKKLSISSAGGEGSNRTEADFIACFMSSENKGQAEENSTWIKFDIAESGTLSFTITPHKEGDDLDFVVYRSIDGSCKNMKIVRCNAAGDPSDWASHSKCLGKTGLRNGESDSSEDAGCNDSDDNAWLAPLNVLKGEKYILLVSNVTTRGPGFDIEFGGTALLPCEKKKPVATVTPKPTKPKPKPTPAIVSKPAPEQIGGRKVEVGEEIKVKNRKIKIRLWDSQVQDGDIISIYLDDRKVIDRIYLTLKPQEFDIELPAGKEHYLTVYADDFGKAEPNTAMVLIFDGIKEQTIDLVAGRSKQESVKIIAE
ncbi:MAG: hypothetical protein J0M29_06250 [Chitinophagales bacterium]|nr:hypothetical protein [Chitinophagales bacterium]